MHACHTRSRSGTAPHHAITVLPDEQSEDSAVCDAAAQKLFEDLDVNVIDETMLRLNSVLASAGATSPATEKVSLAPSPCRPKAPHSCLTLSFLFAASCRELR